MKKDTYIIEENYPLTASVFKMVLRGDTSAITRPGQFVDIKLEGFFLRRPISVCDAREDRLTLIYKVVGDGTRAMSELKAGTELDLLTGLGNGYDLDKSGDAPVLIGGGVGIPPLYKLARELCARGCHVKVVLGFNTAAEIFLVSEFRELGAEVYVTTADGSFGISGFVTDALKTLDYTYFYACGPEAMFRAIEKIARTSGQYSFEERMGCGFGACMGCSCQTKYGSKRICKDGPVLTREEIIW